MSASEDGGPVTRADDVSEEGSLLIEALVGIAMLGVITASVAALLPAVLDAEQRSVSHRAALMVGDTLLEAGTAGIAAQAVPTPAPVGAIRITASMEHDVDGLSDLVNACGAIAAPRAGGTTVTVTHGARDDGREVALRARYRVAPDEVEGQRDLTLRPQHEGVTAETFLVVGPDGAPQPPTLTGPGCATFRDLPAGTSWVTSAGEAPLLVDRLHVPLDQRPIPVSLLERSHDRRFDLAFAGWLRVTMDSGGARLPDHVVGGGLRWYVRGDDANAGMADGGKRAVHPGTVTAVVAPCEDSSTIGSTGVIDVVGGEEVTLSIPLTVVTVEGLQGHTDELLIIQRTTGCADGSDAVPALHFLGGLEEGIQVALPRGEWEAWVRRADQQWALTGSVRFAAAGSDVVARLP